MRFITIILTATVLAAGQLACAEPVANSRPRIEADYQSDVAVCKELSKSEVGPCLKEAQDARKAAYADIWRKRDPASQTRVYYGDLNQNKPRIEKDYQLDAGFCKELGKVDSATCQREALTRKKLAIKSVMVDAREQKAVCPNCGTVTAVNEVDKPGQGSLLGQIGGGVVGGVLGNQVGGGNGRTVATIVGAVGGAIAGNEVEKRARSSRYSEVSFKLNSGEEKVIAFDSSQHGFRVGDKIKFENNQLQHNQ